ncbi:MAG TPA: hypothetical protein VF307_02115 [Candidatus Nanopelagicaceae bacterium]
MGITGEGTLLATAVGRLPVSNSLETASGPSLISAASPAVEPEGILAIEGRVGTDGSEEDALVWIVGFWAFADGIMIAAETPRPRITEAPIALIFIFREKALILNLFRNL